jgi:hypothetical protein
VRQQQFMLNWLTVNSANNLFFYLQTEDAALAVQAYETTG